MALTNISDNSTTTDGTEQTLVTDTTGRVYVACFDLSALAGGDTLEIRVYTKIRSGGTSRVAYLAAYQNAQSQPQKYSPPIPANIEVKVTMKLTAGSNRSVPWCLLGL